MGFDINKPYRTRDGRDAWAAVDPNGNLVGWITDSPTTKTAHFWFPDGVFSKSFRDPQHGFDLVNIPEKRTVKVWINVYADEPCCHYYAHTSRASADRSAEANKCDASRIACIKSEITYEVGEGLEP